MGCFDRVLVPCPRCGNPELFQSKGGDCTLRTYSLENVPFDVVSDINRHSPYTCANCGNNFKVAIKFIAFPVDSNYPEGGSV